MQLLLLLPLLLQKCYMPAYQKYWVCNKSKRTHYAQQLGDNMEETNVYHHALYLKGWKDARLQVAMAKDSIAFWFNAPLLKMCSA